MRIAHAQFPHDSIEKNGQRNEPGCSTSSLSDSLASATRFTTVSSDGEVEHSGDDSVISHLDATRYKNYTMIAILSNFFVTCSNYTLTKSRKTELKQQQLQKCKVSIDIPPAKT